MVNQCLTTPIPHFPKVFGILPGLATKLHSPDKSVDWTSVVYFSCGKALLNPDLLSYPSFGIQEPVSEMVDSYDDLTLYLACLYAVCDHCQQVSVVANSFSIS